MPSTPHTGIHRAASADWQHRNISPAREWRCSPRYMSVMMERYSHEMSDSTRIPNYFTFMWPCIMTDFLTIKPTTRYTDFRKFVLETKLYTFRTVPLSIIRSYSLYAQQWYTSYRFVDSFRAGSRWNCQSRNINYAFRVVMTIHKDYIPHGINLLTFLMDTHSLLSEVVAKFFFSSLDERQFLVNVKDWRLDGC
jgi:hypothetical protein